MSLTKREKECLDVIRRYIYENRLPPTIQNICDELGLKSKNAGFKILTQLENKGYIKRNRFISRGIELVERVEKIGIPIVGKITAGVPITAEENIEGYLSLDQFIGDKDNYFALRVIGDSMVDKGILDGDLAVIRKQNEIFPNQIGAFMINGEFTLKTFKVDKDGRFYLKPENASYRPIYISDLDQFEVKGVLKAIIRSYGEHNETRKY
ncbi:MAG: transcriptional repressor LexA [Deferribacterales bacterium]